MAIKSEPILDAALATFARFGIRKTTMADIADASGVSRQTLYGRFDNKDGILKAVIDYLTQQVLARTNHDWSTLEQLSDKLWVYFTHSTIDVFKLIQSAPDAEELMNGSHVAVKAASDAAEVQKARLLTELFLPYEPSLIAKGQSAAMLGDFVAASAGNLKYSAKTEDALIIGLKTLQSLVLNFIEDKNN